MSLVIYLGKTAWERSGSQDLVLRQDIVDTSTCLGQTQDWGYDGSVKGAAGGGEGEGIDDWKNWSTKEISSSQSSGGMSRE